MPITDIYRPSGNDNDHMLHRCVVDSIGDYTRWIRVPPHDDHDLSIQPAQTVPLLDRAGNPMYDDDGVQRFKDTTLPNTGETITVQIQRKRYIDKDDQYRVVETFQLDGVNTHSLELSSRITGQWMYRIVVTQITGTWRLEIGRE